MRGDDQQQSGMFSYVALEDRVPQEHPLRAIRKLVDESLGAMAQDFDGLYAKAGRPSVPPERLLRAVLLQIFYTVRSERLRMEQMNYNLLFRWFVGLDLGDDEPGPFRGERRSNETHASKTDPEARLYRKGQGQEAKLWVPGACVDGEPPGPDRGRDGDASRRERRTGCGVADAVPEVARPAAPWAARADERRRRQSI